MVRWNKKRPATGVSLRQDGRFEVRVSPKHPLTGKQVDRARILPPGTTLAGAVEARATLLGEVLAELSGEAIPTPSRITVADYAERWIEAKAVVRRATTVDSHSHRIAKAVTPHLGRLTLAELSRSHVVWWRDTIEAQIGDYSAKTVRGWWIVGLAMLRDALADYDLPDCTRRLRAPAGSTPARKTLSTLSVEDVGSLVDAALELSELGILVALLAFTGVRRGEAIAARWCDLDLEARTFCVARSATRVGKQWHLEKPKNGRPRVVGLPMQLVELLKAHHREHPGVGKTLLVPGEAGNPVNPDQLNHAVRRAGERVGLEWRVSPQVLRRTVNTLALASGVDRLVVQAQMGHSGDDMSVHYQGLRGETIRALMDKVWG